MSKHKPNSTQFNAAFVIRHPAYLIASGFGSGLSPVAPGTAGTLFAWVTFCAFQQMTNVYQPKYFWYTWVVLAVLFLIGVWAIDKTGKAIGEVDHGSIVWDEIVPFWAVLLFCRPEWEWQLVAFALFRLFDIAKPQPARFFDDSVKNAFGVMMDDVVAAIYTVLSLVFIGHFWVADGSLG